MLRTLFEQARTRQVRINDEKKQEESDSEDEHDDQDDDHKWEVLLDLVESHKLLCQSFLNLLEGDS